MAKIAEFRLSHVKTGHVTLRVRCEGEEFYRYLHSSVNPQAEAEDWAKRVEKSPRCLYLVLGLGLGYHVEALLRSIPPDAYIIVVHTQDEFGLLQKMPVESPLKCLGDPRVDHVILLNLYHISVVIADFMVDKTLCGIVLCKHYPTMALAPEEYAVVEREAYEAIGRIMRLNISVGINEFHVHFKNYWSNVPYMLRWPGVGVLKGAFADYPVIVVSAGPSLNKNIHLLRECQGKAVIIAASTAIGALVKAGIKPDFLVVCDGSQEMYDVYLRDFFAADITLVAGIQVSKTVIEHYPGPVCFYRPDSCNIIGIEDDLLEVPRLLASVSVATAAVDFAVYCGARQIILLGQDLAYADDGEEYAAGVKGGGYKGCIPVRVPGYYGGEVSSNHQFETVIGYFDTYVRTHPAVQFINATEGGALLAGMKNMPLSAVIKDVLPCDIWSKTFDVSHRQLRRKEMRKIGRLLRDVMADVQGLAEIVEAFLRDIETASINSDVEARIKKYQGFFNHIMKLAGYSYVKTAMQPRIQYLAFLWDNSNVSGEDKYQRSRQLGYFLKDLLGEFRQLLRQSLGSLKSPEGKAHE